jgi:hypothetical protein
MATQNKNKNELVGCGAGVRDDPAGAADSASSAYLNSPARLLGKAFGFGDGPMQVADTLLDTVCQLSKSKANF